MTGSKNIQQQTKFEILLIGDNCTDIYQYGIVERISPEAPVPVFKFTHEENKPGMAGNVHINLKSLGCNVHFLHGNISTKTRLIDTRSRQHIVRIDNDNISCPLFLDTLDLSPYDAIVVSDCEKGAISYELIQRLRDRFRGPIFVDTKKNNLSKIAGCIIKINQQEYNSLISKPDMHSTIVTCGAAGVEWDDKIFPVVKLDIIDGCGAGDTFLSAFVYQYLSSKNMEKSIQFAIDASSITVQHLGCYAPTLTEILSVAKV